MLDEIRSAIERAKFAAMEMAYRVAAASDQEAMDAISAEIQTGVREIDALLPHVDADNPSDALRMRWEFLDRVLKAGDEPPDNNHQRRGRPKTATKAAEHLLEAAALLSELDNASLSTALTQLAGIVRARAATSEISAVLKTSGIAPGTQVLARYRMRHGSTAFTGAGGKSAKKTEMVRFITWPLNANAPSEAVAELLSHVLNITCSRRDVEQARQQMKPQNPKQEESPGAALQAAMGFGRRPG